VSDVSPDVVLQGERLLLRPASLDDVEALLAIVTEPEVARWWGDCDADEVRTDLPGSFAIVVDGAVGGWLLVAEETAAHYRHVGFDIALTTALHGRGYGPEALRLAIAHFAACGHHRFTIDPAAANERAIRAYRSVGFKPVGVMREYERGPDGAWHDGLLMDLLASEVEP
jgi:aminoglycoside 6'-N-acetyltransferase